ncbi:hypothetical protein [Sinorhizobium meliloti]|uniref:hypothetical protein n=1 Tax=Rhizobium meliloti TaxID=382 RepID=UPI000FD97BCE|nr:hypothetical protein [Sinorhizobium meliloti]RVK41434.1 hypothetical protein CN163_06915 [Sinorhizobium meliloti]
MDEDFIEADEDLAAAKVDDRMSRNIPFLRKVAAVVEEIESIQDEMSEEAGCSSGEGRTPGRGRSRILLDGAGVREGRMTRATARKCCVSSLRYNNAALTSDPPAGAIPPIHQFTGAPRSNVWR